MFFITRMLCAGRVGAGGEDPDPPDGISPFNMVAGLYGGIYPGYSIYPDYPAGSIDVEPIPSNTLVLMIWVGGPAYCVFVGNIVSLLEGKELWINSVNYGRSVMGPEHSPPQPTDWIYDSDGTVFGFPDSTVGGWIPPSAPEFADGVSYFIELK